VLLTQLTPQNAASILLLADTYHSVALKQSVVNLAVAYVPFLLFYIIYIFNSRSASYLLTILNFHLLYRNFEAVLMSSDFVDLCKNSPTLVAELNIARAEYTKEFNRQNKKKKQ
jgi:hypothetical protein